MTHDLRALWQKVSDELDHIPGGMHADLEDAASALWNAFDTLASPPAAPDMREALEKALAKVTPYHDGACTNCGGVGETFAHAPDCDNDNCALAGGIDDCNGHVEPCHCLNDFVNEVSAALASSPMDAVKAAVEAEREACAALADEQFSDRGWSAHYKRAGESIAFAIRARAGGAK